jgi:hypothetical protein
VTEFTRHWANAFCHTRRHHAPRPCTPWPWLAALARGFTVSDNGIVVIAKAESVEAALAENI